MNNRSQSEPLLNYDEVFKHVSSKFVSVFEHNNPIIDENHDKRHKETRYILTQFLNLYTTVRAPTRDSFFNKMQYALQKTASYIYSSEPTQDVIKKINENVLNAINKIKSFVDVFSLLVELRRYAEIAQDKKMTNEPSLLSLTLHSMACYLISSYHYSFKTLTDALRNEEQDIHRQLDKEYAENRGLKVGALNRERNLIIGALAMLNHFYGVNHANNMKLLSYYKLPVESSVEHKEWQEYNNKNEYNIDLNFGVPIIYQTSLCIYYVYEKYYRESERNTFKDFISHAVKSGEKADKDIHERKVEPMSFTRDLVLALDDSFDVKNLPGDAPYAYVLTSKGMWHVNRVSASCERIKIDQNLLEKIIIDYDLSSRLKEAKQSSSSSSFYLESLTQTQIEYFEASRVGTPLPVTTPDNAKITSSSNKTPPATALTSPLPAVVPSSPPPSPTTSGDSVSRDSSSTDEERVIEEVPVVPAPSM